MKSAAELAKALITAQVEPMNPTRAQFYTLLCMLSESGKPLTEPFYKAFPFRVMAARAEYYHIKADGYAIAALAMGASRNVAEVVMYTTVLMHLQEVNERPVKMSDISLTFPRGFPIEAETHRIWDAQKIPHEMRRELLIKEMRSDNRIDYDGFWIDAEQLLTEYTKYEDH